MKVNLRIIIGILCGVAMVSCTSTVSEPNTSQIPIQFGTSVSRAAVNSASDMTAFSVWGGYDNVKLFEGTKVNNTGSGWTYEGGDRYWVPDKTFNFYAFYPVEVTPNFNIETDKSFFTLNNYPLGNADKDLMIAVTPALDSDVQANAPVQFSFRHLLTQVDFVIKTDLETESFLGKATVVSAHFYGMHSAADYDGSSFDVNDKMQSGVWTPAGEIISKDNTPFKVNNKELDSTGKSLFGNPFLLFPLLKDETVFLDFVYKFEKDTKEYNKTLNLSVMTPRGWISGNNYRYGITIIDTENILFEKPTVNPWNTGIGGIIIVE